MQVMYVAYRRILARFVTAADALAALLARTAFNDGSASETRLHASTNHLLADARHGCDSEKKCDVSGNVKGG